MCLTFAQKEMDLADLKNDQSALKFDWDQLQGYKDEAKRQISIGAVGNEAVESLIEKVDSMEESVNEILNQNNGLETKLSRGRSKRELHSFLRNLSRKVSKAHEQVDKLILQISKIDNIRRQQQRQQEGQDLRQEEEEEELVILANQLEEQRLQKQRQVLQQRQHQQEEEEEQQHEEREPELARQRDQQQEEERQQMLHQEQQQVQQQPQEQQLDMQSTETNDRGEWRRFGIAYGFSRSAFSLEELRVATDNFNKANILGEGGYGIIYKGILPNNKVVAIKSHKVVGAVGRFEERFFHEIEAISRINHRNIVTLVGYCITESEKLLVYEFISNRTLAYHLHGDGKPTMDWSTRRKIAIGCAKGLAYLHEDCAPTIIHRDIKTTNILLDDNFEPKVADFGLFKYLLGTRGHVSTMVAGTFGYMDPEYVSTGRATIKSDVYSFGVVLLELITGREHESRHLTYPCNTLVGWARPSLESGNYDALVDPLLQKNYNRQEMTNMIACAAACVLKAVAQRPSSSQIVRILEGAVRVLPNLSAGEIKIPENRAESSNRNGSNGSNPTFYSLPPMGNAQSDKPPIKKVYSHRSKKNGGNEIGTIGSK